MSEGWTEETVVEAKDPNDTRTLIKQQMTPPKPNRKERTRNASLMAHFQKEQNKVSTRRAENYKQLQQWLATQKKLSSTEADEVFKRMLKKIFKKDLKGEEFGQALTASIRSLKYIPIAMEVKNES